MKVKIFEETNSSALERKVNEFISEGKKDIISLHYQVASFNADKHLDFIFSCLIEYKEN